MMTAAAIVSTAGTLGYLHTGDLRAVQDFMGHADPRMTAKYAMWWTWPRRIRRCSFR